MVKDNQKIQDIKLWPSIMMIGLIRFYRYIISPWIGSHCRFTPTCSAYALECYQKKGFIKGTYLTFRRLLKCHPWHKGGVDDVPNKTKTDSGSIKN